MTDSHAHNTGSSSRANDFVAALGSSWRSTGPIAEEAIARDVAECTSDDDSPSDTAVDLSSSSDSDDPTHPGPTLYRRPSGVAYGTARPAINPVLEAGPVLTRLEKKQSRQAERSLLRDNHVLPPKRSRQDREPTWWERWYATLFSTKVRGGEVGAAALEEGPVEPASERTPLLGDAAAPGAGAGAGEHVREHEHLNEQWDEAVAAGKIKTTWQREAKTIATYAAPLTLTFILQYSVIVTSVFAVGRIGKVELGAVSLAAMTSTITGYAVIQGLCTSLDTLCAQAYGSGRKHLVGLQLQRMTFFLLLCFVPIALIWWHGEAILAVLVPERRSAELAGRYLRVLILGGPGYIAFEGGKRFVMAQGLFQATTYVLLIAAPLNVLVTWLLVWHFEWGFIGAPVAIVFTETLMPLLLLSYVVFIDGKQCWGGFSRRAWTNWGTMIRLALPGMIMVEAEYLAFEILTLFSSRFGTEYLAGQSVLVTLCAISYQLPFPLSIAASTRIANLVGAGLVDAARVTAYVLLGAGALVGVFNFILYVSLRSQLPWLFTKDPQVAAIVAKVIPLVAVMQVFDGLCSGAHGLLRGIGQQSIGGYVNLGVYYLIAIPLSFGTAFGLGWKLWGLWTGVTTGLIIVAVIEYSFAFLSDWDKAASEAQRRNAAG